MPYVKHTYEERQVQDYRSAYGNTVEQYTRTDVYCSCGVFHMRKGPDTRVEFLIHVQDAIQDHLSRSPRYLPASTEYLEKQDQLPLE